MSDTVRRFRYVLIVAGVMAGLSLMPARASSGGCGRPMATGDATVHVSSQGQTYPVLVHVPTGYDGRRRIALVFNLHGSTQSGSQHEASTGMDAAGDRHGFAIAYPNGGVPTLPTGDPGLPASYYWNVPGVPLVGGIPVPPGSRDDVRFLLDASTSISSVLCIDQRAIFATGASGGGRMASALGCLASSRFAAIAPVMGVRAGNPDQADPSRPDPSTCRPSRPVPVLAIHGEKDPVDPYDGGGEAYWGYSVPTAMARWAALDGCRPQPRAARVTATVTKHAWSDCRGHADVWLYSSSISGHEWPGQPAPTGLGVALGPSDMSISANEVIWAFFATHPLPRH